MGQLGNFMSAVTFLALLAGGGIVNGVIKYVAEYRLRPHALVRFITAAKTYSLFMCLLVFVVGVLFSKPISGYVFKQEGYYWIILILSVAQFGFAFSNLVTGTSNGLHDTKTYALIQVIGNLLVIPLAWVLIRYFQFAGAAISVVLFYLVYSFPALFFYYRFSLKQHIRGWSFDRGQFKSLMSFSMMACVGAISVPLVEIVVRSALVHEVGYAAAGIWQASIKLASAYMGFFVVFFAAYFMPLVSAQKDSAYIGGLVFKFMRIAAGVFLVGGGAFYVLRDNLIPLFLSPEFFELSDLIGYQLAGDFFRVVSYVIAFVIVAKASLKLYLISEITQGLMFCSLSLLAINVGWGVKGVFYAHVVMNIIYFLCMLIGFFVYLKRREASHAVG
ncbi:Lipid III flippase [Pseudomonas wadenswilerensis]|uniref:Lipid III flippase n=3 Tax=Pseudomonas wadenswilerensis TaxID=1785161 RepID=A0A380SXW5_9PSED|nr:Lipid III flippase [Pseudomonas wadenswilerensis]